MLDKNRNKNPNFPLIFRFLSKKPLITILFSDFKSGICLTAQIFSIARARSARSSRSSSQLESTGSYRSYSWITVYSSLGQTKSGRLYRSHSNNSNIRWSDFMSQIQLKLLHMDHMIWALQNLVWGPQKYSKETGVQLSNWTLYNRRAYYLFLMDGHYGPLVHM